MAPPPTSQQHHVTFPRNLNLLHQHRCVLDTSLWPTRYTEASPLLCALFSKPTDRFVCVNVTHQTLSLCFNSSTSGSSPGLASHLGHVKTLLLAHIMLKCERKISQFRTSSSLRSSLLLVQCEIFGWIYDYNIGRAWNRATNINKAHSLHQLLAFPSLRITVTCI